MASTTNVLQYISLAGLLLFLVKGSYVILIAIEAMQLLYFHSYFLMAYPQNFFTVIKELSIFNFKFLPDPFVFTRNYTSNVTIPEYAELVPDLTFMRNTHQYFLIAAFLVLLVAVLMLAADKNLNPCECRAKVRWVLNRRFKWGIVNELVWYSFLSVLFFAFLQFRDWSTPAPWCYVNLILAVALPLLVLAYPCYLLRRAVQFHSQPQRLPKGLRFMLLEGSGPWELLVRYVRKVLFCVALAAPSFHLQIVPLLAVNVFFTAFLLYLRPHARAGNNLFIVLNEALLILLEVLLVVYYSKVRNTPLTGDEDLSWGWVFIGLVIARFVLFLAWLLYQLVLVILETAWAQKVMLEYEIFRNYVNINREDQFRVDAEQDRHAKLPALDDDDDEDYGAVAKEIIEEEKY